ncbi:retropepsin-like aspartic protease family protein [Martelella mediterranea]|uniref:Aspartyl protease family protein n=1 Tax=Martelella mediterranea TaxID=293089 RepID=A0A4V2V4L8_9HYPH|nr:TIGR02281 family clan AA aspartic protease [Martelella mediterranea]TCT40923.1 aspartyl protease family protein [Martelella mediterranea]
MRLFWILTAVVAIGTIMLMVTGNDGTTLGMNSDDFAEGLWLVPILLLVSAGFLQSRRDMGEMVRNLLIWIAILLVVAMGYIFRHDFQDIGTRLMGGLVPGMAVTTTASDGRQQVVIGKRRDGHFQVSARVNGTELPMMVDTGASRITLTERDAEKAGIAASSLSYTVMVQTANGTAMAAPVKLDEVTIGGITRRNVPAMVASQGRLSESLLGMSFLSTLSSVDMRADELRLTD